MARGRFWLLIGIAAALLALPRPARCDALELHLVLPGARWEARAAPGRGLALTDVEVTPAPGHASALVAAMASLRDGPGARRAPLVRPGELRALALGTALLLATDERTIKLFDPDLHGHPPGDGPGKSISRLGNNLSLAALAVAPSLVDGKYGRKTTGLTAMALLNAGLLTEGAKFLAGRERPSQSGGRTRFHGPGRGFASFPSGHAAGLFAVAEVEGHRYPGLRLPLYLLAAAVGWGRINAAAHFPSDVFVGATIGIYSGRLVLRRGGRLLPWR